MEIILATNGYFFVVFSWLVYRNLIFEGGPYFHNQADLFIKPWHVGFDPVEKSLSKILVWVHIPLLPIEFW